MEIVKTLKVRGKEIDVWMDRDPEGRKCYGIEWKIDGCAVEPAACPYCSISEAVKAAKAD